MASYGPAPLSFPISRAHKRANGGEASTTNLFKMASSDLFSLTAVLRTMADVGPNHPVVQSMTAVYWRGGDEALESALFQPQFFDKIVAWGGENSMRHIRRYLGPGIELVAFDPKTSYSFIGREAFADEATLARRFMILAF